MSAGYQVYPTEMWLGSRRCDVVARKDGAVYAFELKSSADDVSAGYWQAHHYQAYADYAVLVTVEPVSDRLYALLFAQGVGWWQLTDCGVNMGLPPIRNVVHDGIRRVILRRFSRHA